MAETTGKFRCPIQGCGLFMETFVTESGKMMLYCRNDSTAKMTHTCIVGVSALESEDVKDALRVKED